jgi:tetratricopeptide (TPR) repeat protein
MNDLETKIIGLNKNNKIEINDKIEKIEILIEEKLKQEPNNIELWLKLAMLELEIPLVDHEKSIKCLEKVLTIEKNHAITTLLLATVHNYYLGDIDEMLVNKLNTIQTDSDEINSMLKYATSWFYEYKDTKQEEKLLKESINIYPKHVCNYVSLAKLYFRLGKDAEAKKLVQKALKNVKKIYSDCDIDYIPTSVEEFLNEYVKGIHLPNIVFKMIEEMIEKGNDSSLCKPIT